MFRSTFIYLSKADWARNIVTKWAFARRAASRFVAGETLDQAIEAVTTLNRRGINATLDHLGEHTTTLEAARNATQAILEIVDAIDGSGVRANISIKLTQIGLAVDLDGCRDNLRSILLKAGDKGIFVRIDMEDAPWTETTLNLYRQLHDQEGYENCGVVIQTYLYRSEGDVTALAEEGTRVRLCKGAYKEPPEIAYPKKVDVDAAYDRLAKILIDGAISNGSPSLSEDGRIPPIPAIASHDPARLTFAQEYAVRAGLPKSSLEFQMLYGIRRDLQEKMAAQGYPVRIYVPYGTEWYPYFVRRLAERPANLWFFISNFFRK
jgi:proline dehydrogenase